MKILPILLISLLLQGCAYYNYATLSDENATGYQLNNRDDDDSKWQFSSALYDEKGLYIELTHLRRHHHKEGLNDFHQIYINTRKSKESNSDLLTASIVVTVEDLEGNLIKQIKDPAIAGRGAAVFFYPLELDEQLIEKIEFKIKEGNEIKSVKYTFEVHKKLNYTSWSVMMSV